MRKVLKFAAIGILALVLLAAAWAWWYSASNRAVPAPDAVAALVSDERVTVSDGRWLVYRPAGRQPAVGVILYPGAHCDVRGYAPVLRRVAEQGYLVVNVSMPMDFAVLAPNRAAAVIEAHPEIERWLLVGHSLGGAMAASFVHGHPGAVDGLMLWDSYPPGSANLTGSDIPVWLVHRATPDGRPPEAFSNRRGLFPVNAEWIAIPGGNHMNFGSFIGGPYEEEWEASISRDDQHEQIVEATLVALRKISQ